MQVEIGKKFTQLKVIEHHSTDEYSHKHFLCKCSSGNMTIVREGHLKSGHTQSCGCLRGHNNRKNHGQSD